MIRDSMHAFIFVIFIFQSIAIVANLAALGREPFSSSPDTRGIVAIRLVFLIGFVWWAATILWGAK